MRLGCFVRNAFVGPLMGVSSVQDRTFVLRLRPPVTLSVQDRTMGLRLRPRVGVVDFAATHFSTFVAFVALFLGPIVHELESWSV